MHSGLFLFFERAHLSCALLTFEQGWSNVLLPLSLTCSSLS